MKLVIMQPYFLPYIGYFQLMAAADKFVVLDDVNYIKGGWINRNRILATSEQSTRWITIPLRGASPNREILEIEIASEMKWKEKLIMQVEMAYKNATHFNQGRELIEEVVRCEATNLSEFLTASLKLLAQRLELKAEFVDSSRAYPKCELSGQDRILDICLKEQADEYINPPGGRKLYSADVFSANHISLRFLNPKLDPYGQGGRSFFPGLSILDILMWNPIEEVRQRVQNFTVEI